MNHSENYLYHVTYVNRLESITEDGLVPGSQSSIGGIALNANRTGRIFMSDDEGVSYWFSKAEDWADHLSDDPIEEGFLPVVLRYSWPDDFEDDDAWQEDEPGAQDSRNESFHFAGEIHPDSLELSIGDDWVELDDLGKIVSLLGEYSRTHDDFTPLNFPGQL